MERLAPDELQDGQAGRGDGRGDVGLEAQGPDLHVGSHRLSRQLQRQGFVIGIGIVGDDQARPVGPIGPQFRTAFAHAPGHEVRPGLHDAQPEAHDLLRQQAAKIQRASFVAVGLQEHRPGKQIHRVRDLAEQAPEAGASGLFRVGAQHVPILFELQHPHVPGSANGRHAPGSGEKEEVAVEQVRR